MFPLTVEQTPTVPLEILNPRSSYGLGLRRGDLVVHDLYSMAFRLAAIGGRSVGTAVGAHEDADLERNFVRIGHGLSLPPRLLWLAGSPRKTSPLATVRAETSVVAGADDKDVAAGGVRCSRWNFGSA